MSEKNYKVEKRTVDGEKITYLVNNKKSGTPGVVGFICGIVSIFLPIPFIDIIVAIVGFVCSIIGAQEDRQNRSLAIAGIVISVFGFIASVFYTFFIFPMLV